MNYSIRPLIQEDEPFLWQMLYEAAHMAEEGNLTIQDAMNHPELARYVKNWGANGDMGFLASLVDSNQPVGAAWIRLLTGENRGYGYINDKTPELAIAILPEYRNQGIGTQLLTHLLAAAKAFYPSISLSIRSSNPALRLYQKLGWRAVEGSEVINRVGGTSFKMKLDLS
ncbi:GNAT family N-acetyltransferase [Calothrix sp. FACHB-1219]|uniref:GNAT family N-acetyltransferase n=1 Tax=unclassified Calothrix TaxID=2619626 RepID=UPI001686DCC1|nr:MULTISPECIES: GNAT family N-acetyltransferase [unclassified Calothrix]MBD2201880.1 GNAT family N-acetyltransferase [Calothrix sp. FACHB-168]MBD2217566.1 GNAT family N-acetyltransferase [Calothrix sp. FACHB-1219]